MMQYYSDAKSYLNRARKRLDENTLESLFYAAFELRCGVEQRMREYLEFQKHVSEKKKNGWRIINLGRSIEKAFKGFKRIVKFTFCDQKREKIYCVLYYTPVTPELQSMAKKLGNYLHRMQTHKGINDPWWDDFKDLLEVTYKSLKFACFGNLLGLPLLRPDGTVEMPMSANSSTMVFKDFHKNDTFQVKVEYLDELPE